MEENTRREIEDFLIREAELLDRRSFREWLTLLDDEIRYFMPVRPAQSPAETREQEREMAHFEEDLASLKMRVARIETGYAWAETPPTRTRHFVSNLRLRHSDRSDEIEVTANLLVYAVRADEANYEIVSGERDDLIRRRNGSWKLLRRRVSLDPPIPTMPFSVLF